MLLRSYSLLLCIFNFWLIYAPSSLPPPPPINILESKRKTPQDILNIYKVYATDGEYKNHNDFDRNSIIDRNDINILYHMWKEDLYNLDSLDAVCSSSTLWITSQWYDVRRGMEMLEKHVTYYVNNVQNVSETRVCFDEYDATSCMYNTHLLVNDDDQHVLEITVDPVDGQYELFIFNVTAFDPWLPHQIVVSIDSIMDDPFASPNSESLYLNMMNFGGSFHNISDMFDYPLREIDNCFYASPPHPPSPPSLPPLPPSLPPESPPPPPSSPPSPPLPPLTPGYNIYYIDSFNVELNMSNFSLQWYFDLLYEHTQYVVPALDAYSFIQINNQDIININTNITYIQNDTITFLLYNILQDFCINTLHNNITIQSLYDLSCNLFDRNVLIVQNPPPPPLPPPSTPPLPPTIPSPSPPTSECIPTFLLPYRYELQNDSPGFQTVNKGEFAFINTDPSVNQGNVNIYVNDKHYEIQDGQHHISGWQHETYNMINSVSYISSKPYPSLISGIVRTDELYSDRKRISIVYQVHSSLYNTKVNSRQIDLYIGTNTGTIAKNCDIPDNNGIGYCNVEETEVSPDLFDDSIVSFVPQLRLQLQDGNYIYDTLSGINFMPAPPNHFELTAYGIRMILPKSPRFRGDTIILSLYANSEGELLEAWGININFNHTQIQYISSQYSTAWFTPTENTMYDGIYKAASIELLDDTYGSGSDIYIGQLEFRIRENATEGIETSITGLVTSFIGDVSDDFGPENTPEYMKHQDYRSGNQNEGILKIDTIVPTGIFSYVDNDWSNLINTAVFDGNPVSNTIHAKMFFNRYESTVLDSPQISCSNNDTRVIHLTQQQLTQCHIEVNSTHNQASDNIVINVNAIDYPDLNAIVQIIVWYPTILNITIDDPILNRISKVMGFDCIETIFQSTYVHAYTRFTNGNIITDLLDITHLVTFKSLTTDIIIEGTHVSINGTVNSSITDTIIPIIHGSLTINDVSVYTSFNNIVEADLRVQSVNEIDFRLYDSPIDYSPESTWTTNVIFNSSFKSLGQSADLFTYYVFTDGNLQSITPTNVISEIPEYISIDNMQDQITIKVADNATSGCFSRAVRVEHLLCDINAVNYLPVNLQLPVPIMVTLSTNVNKITYTNDNAVLHGINNNVNLTVSVDYDVGPSAVRTFHSSTILNLDTESLPCASIDGNNVVMQNTDVCRHISVIRVNVTFESLTHFVDINVVTFEGLDVVVKVCQDANCDSLGNEVNELQYIACSDEIERAKVVVYGMLSDGTTTNELNSESSLGEFCDNTCERINGNSLVMDGDCDDGGPGSDYSFL